MDSGGYYLETGKKNVLFVFNLELQAGFDDGREASCIAGESES